jgi:hypothetical protein
MLQTTVQISLVQWIKLSKKFQSHIRVTLKLLSLMLHVICKDIQRHNTLTFTHKFFNSAHKKEKNWVSCSKATWLLIQPQIQFPFRYINDLVTAHILVILQRSAWIMKCSLRYRTMEHTTNCTEALKDFFSSRYFSILL